MIRPDALPVSPTGPTVGLSSGDVAALFGRGYALRGTERVGLARLGRDGGYALLVDGPPGLSVDAATADALGGLDGVRLVGPAGSVAATAVRRVEARLVLPAGLRRAWGVGDVATVALGSVAVEASVGEATETALAVDRALWLAAGRPTTARWLPGVSWTVAVPEDSPESDAITGVGRRVVTETDVRQARLHGRRIRLAPGQIVTPAARSLAREWNVFEGEPTGPSAPRRT